MITPLEQEVLSLIDDNELVRWVQKLTRIPSVWRPEVPLGEEAAARWVEARCQEIGLETHVRGNQYLPASGRRRRAERPEKFRAGGVGYVRGVVRRTPLGDGDGYCQSAWCGGRRR